MKFTCEIDMDNAAFEDPHELARLLARITRASRNTTGASVIDSNGNKVGSWSIT